MLVHSCTVDNGHGDVFEVLNNDGCTPDRFVFQNLELSSCVERLLPPASSYTSDLMAGHEMHVFKYHDLPLLQFACQIQIIVKVNIWLCMHQIDAINRRRCLSIGAKKG
jgi:hypothetical protein